MTRDWISVHAKQKLILCVHLFARTRTEYSCWATHRSAKVRWCHNLWPPNIYTLTIPASVSCCQSLHIVYPLSLYLYLVGIHFHRANWDITMCASHSIHENTQTRIHRQRTNEQTLIVGTDDSLIRRTEKTIVSVSIFLSLFSTLSPRTTAHQNKSTQWNHTTKITTTTTTNKPKNLFWFCFHSITIRWMSSAN